MNAEKEKSGIRRAVLEGALEALRISDPGFTEQGLLDRVRDAYETWQKPRGFSGARWACPDGAYSRMNSPDFPPEMHGARAASAVIGSMERSGPFDLVEVHLRPGSPKAPALKNWYDVWTLLRRRGARTPSTPRPLGRCCPCCGCASPWGGKAACPSCGKSSLTAERDWIVAEMRSGADHVWLKGLYPSGVPSLRVADPDFLVPALEDRAAAFFWRWLEARRIRDMSPLLMFVKDGAYERIESGVLAAEPPAERVLLKYIGLCAAYAGEDRDRALVGASWWENGADTRRMFNLSRRSGARTDLSRALTALHCPACGGEILHCAEPLCEYCGAKLNDGSDWVLEEVWDYSSGEEPGFSEFYDAAHKASCGAGIGASLTLYGNGKYIRHLNEPVRRLLRKMVPGRQADAAAKLQLTLLSRARLLSCGSLADYAASLVDLSGKPGPDAPPEEIFLDLASLAFRSGELSPDERQAMKVAAGVLGIAWHRAEELLSGEGKRRADEIRPRLLLLDP